MSKSLPCRTLSNTLLESDRDHPSKNKCKCSKTFLCVLSYHWTLLCIATGRRREYRTKTSQRPFLPPAVPSVSPLLHTAQSSVPICHTQVALPSCSSSAVLSAPEPTPSSSPRKKRWCGTIKSMFTVCTFQRA